MFDAVAWILLGVVCATTYVLLLRTERLDKRLRAIEQAQNYPEQIIYPANDEVF